MIRLLTRRDWAAGSFMSRLTHPHPEQLAELAGAGGAGGRVAKFSRVVSSIRIGSIHKLTSPDRLGEANQVLARRLAEQSVEAVQFLDVGGSDGITTLDAVKQLESELGIAVTATLADRYTRLIHFAKGAFHEYRMPDGSPVMVRLGPIGLQLSSVETTNDPLSRLLGRWYLGRVGARAAMQERETMSLLNPVVAADDAVSLVEWNALEPREQWSGAFNAVRAANILNESYFTREEIETIVGHIHGYLVKDGLLLVTRNHIEDGGEAERGSLWRRTDTGFTRLDDFGGGSAVRHMVDELRV